MRKGNHCHYEPGGRGFKSCRARQTHQGLDRIDLALFHCYAVATAACQPQQPQPNCIFMPYPLCRTATYVSPDVPSAGMEVAKIRSLMALWAWECLRRRYDYQVSFDRYKAIPKEIRKQGGRQRDHAGRV